MFARDRRAKFPKLPAYETCNNAKSKLEHYLIAVLPFGGQYTDELVASLKWSRGTWHQGNCRHGQPSIHDASAVLIIRARSEPR